MAVNDHQEYPYTAELFRNSMISPQREASLSLVNSSCTRSQLSAESAQRPFSTVISSMVNTPQQYVLAENHLREGPNDRNPVSKIQPYY